MAAPGDQGTDPLNTGCAAGAATAYSGSVAGMAYEIRYSSACGTNWVRIPSLDGGVHMVIKSAWGGGVVGGSQWGSGGGHWTPQVYAPGSTCITFYVERLISGSPNTRNIRLC